MREWKLRSVEEANLLNPAFLGLVIRQSVLGYCELKPEGAPYPLVFLIPPLVLHQETRSSLPKSIATKFATWITRPEGAKAKIGFASRARGLSPYVRESVLFATKRSLVSFSEKTGLFFAGKQNSQPSSISEEVKSCYKTSLFCGRWAADAGKIETMMALLGVRP